MGQFIDLTGERFGYLTVIRRVPNRGGHTAWECVCDCGVHVVVAGHALKSGHTKSCGCYQRQRASEVQQKHNEANSSRLYNIWINMKSRCNCPTCRDYKDYGARGIHVCEEWQNDFLAFKLWALRNGYSDEKSLDRKNNDLGYSPDNCRWSTAIEQNNNRRSNFRVTYEGETHTIAEWARFFGINYFTLYSRIRQSGRDPIDVIAELHR